MEFIQWIVIGWFSLTFMIPFVAWNCLLIYCVEDESPGYAFGLTIFFILLIQICSDFSIPGWINLNAGSFIKWGLAYIGVGVIYSTIKYILYLTDKRRTFDKKFNRFKSKHKLKSDVTIENVPNVHKHICYETMRFVSIPDLFESTKYIVFWMSYWPWSAFWTILNNPLKWLFEELKEMFSGLWKGLHKRILGSRQDALEELKKYK